MSGEALHSTQFTPSSDRAMDDWVRAWARRLPLRKPAQLAQLQFHWGNRRRRRNLESGQTWLLHLQTEIKNAPADRGVVLRA